MALSVLKMSSMSLLFAMIGFIWYTFNVKLVKLKDITEHVRTELMAENSDLLWTSYNYQPCLIVKQSTDDGDGQTMVNRVSYLNQAIDHIRNRTIARRANSWSNSSFHHYAIALDVIRESEDVVRRLSSYQGVQTVALRWVIARAAGATGNLPSWSSLNDTTNLLVQKYFTPTGDMRYCKYVMNNVSDDVGKCMKISEASAPVSLEPEYIHWRPLTASNQSRGDNINMVYFEKYPYVVNPHSMMYLHLISDSIVTDNGYIFNGQFKYVPSGCQSDYSSALPSAWKHLTVHPEVFVISQNYGNAVFHRMIDVMPRVAPFREFLIRHPQIKIHAIYNTVGRLEELLTILGIHRSRLISGNVRAIIAYVPPAFSCAFSRVQQTQLLNSIYGDYIDQHFSPESQHRVILIKRSIKKDVPRRFLQQKAIEKVVKSAARDFNLTYTLFSDIFIVTLNETMRLFHSAVMVVAPHGAGQSNLIFSRPGLYVVEGVCNPPFTHFCYRHLAHILGQHWHGVMSRDGCQDIIDIDSSDIDTAVRQYLHIWQQTDRR